jgi:hypothetical protein
MSSPRILVGFVLLDLFIFLCNVLYIFVCPIVLFLLAIALSVLLQLMASDDTFVIFKLFVKWELSNKQYVFILSKPHSKASIKKQYSPRFVLDQKSGCNFDIEYWLKQ